MSMKYTEKFPVVGNHDYAKLGDILDHIRETTTDGMDMAYSQPSANCLAIIDGEGNCAYIVEVRAPKDTEEHAALQEAFEEHEANLQIEEEEDK